MGVFCSWMKLTLVSVLRESLFAVSIKCQLIKCSESGDSPLVYIWGTWSGTRKCWELVVMRRIFWESFFFGNESVRDIVIVELTIDLPYIIWKTGEVAFIKLPYRITLDKSFCTFLVLRILCPIWRTLKIWDVLGSSLKEFLLVGAVWTPGCTKHYGTIISETCSEMIVSVEVCWWCKKKCACSTSYDHSYNGPESKFFIHDAYYIYRLRILNVDERQLKS